MGTAHLTIPYPMRVNDILGMLPEDGRVIPRELRPRHATLYLAVGGLLLMGVALVFAFSERD